MAKANGLGASNPRRHPEGLGAVVLGHLHLHVPGLEQRFGEGAQLLEIGAGIDGPRLGFMLKLAGQGQVRHDLEAM